VWYNIKHSFIKNGKKIKKHLFDFLFLKWLVAKAQNMTLMFFVDMPIEIFLMSMKFNEI